MTKNEKEVCMFHSDQKHMLEQIYGTSTDNQVQLGRIMERLEKKREADQTRNGKIDKIDEKEDDIAIRVSNVEGSLSTTLKFIVTFFTIVLTIQGVILYWLFQHLTGG